MSGILSFLSSYSGEQNSLIRQIYKRAEELASLIGVFLGKHFIKMALIIFVQVHSKHFIPWNKSLTFFLNLIFYPFKPTS